MEQRIEGKKEGREDAMERSSQEEESGDELQQQWKQLEDWNSINQSNPGRVQVQHCWVTPTPGSNVRSAAVSTLELLEDTLRRDLISSLHPPSEGGRWKVRNNDLVVEEILRERRAAIESGKLKGRRLFDLDFDLDALGGSRTRDLDINIRWGEDMCSGCSSVLIQGSEVKSMCSSSCDGDGDDDDNGNDGDHWFHHGASLGGHLHLSSTSSMSARKMERDKVVTSAGEKRHIWRVGGGDGERGMVLMVCIGIVLVLFALGIISLKRFEEGFGDQQAFDVLIPT